MAQRPPAIGFDEVPLDEARRMSREPRMHLELSHALKQKIPSLEDTATRMPLREDIRPTTMKNRILRVAVALGMPVTVRKVPGGLLFWRSTAEDCHQGTELAQRLQIARSKGRARPGRRRRA